MRRKDFGAFAPPREFAEDIVPKGGGGQRTGYRPYSAATEQLKGQVERSVEERGGYPMRGDRPMMTKMEARRLERQRQAEEDRPNRQRFRKGGMVQTRDYCK